MKTDISSKIFAETTMPEENVKELAKESGKRNIMKNLVIVSISIFILYVPFESLLNLQSTMNVKYNMGMLSTMITFASSILSCLFLLKLIMKKLGCKYTMVFSAFAFSPFYAANFYLYMGTYFPLAALFGIASGILWPILFIYINEISELYAAHGADSLDVITSRFWGIFYMLYNFSQICGNLISFYILKPNDLTSNEGFTADNSSVVLKSLYRHDNVSCGANFCGGMNENLLPPSELKRYVLSGFYVCCALTSALTLFIFMDPLKKKETKSTQDDGLFSGLIATLNHVRNTDQLLLVPLTIYLGLQEVFIYADYSRAFVGCAWGLHNISLVFLCFGVVSAIMPVVSGRLIKYVPRYLVMVTGAVGNIGVCTVLLVWQPKSDEIIYFFILVVVWGISYAIWDTQIFALYGHLFKEDQEAAFINLRFWYSIASMIGYGCSSFLCMYQKIYILLASLIVGLMGYFTIEIRKSIFKKTYIVSDSVQKS